MLTKGGITHENQQKESGHLAMSGWADRCAASCKSRVKAAKLFHRGTCAAPTVAAIAAALGVDVTEIIEQED